MSTEEDVYLKAASQEGTANIADSLAASSSGELSATRKTRRMPAPILSLSATDRQDGRTAPPSRVHAIVVSCPPGVFCFRPQDGRFTRSLFNGRPHRRTHIRTSCYFQYKKIASSLIDLISRELLFLNLAFISNCPTGRSSDCETRECARPMRNFTRLRIPGVKRRVRFYISNYLRRRDPIATSRDAYCALRLYQTATSRRGRSGRRTTANYRAIRKCK